MKKTTLTKSLPTKILEIATWDVVKLARSRKCNIYLIPEGMQPSMVCDDDAAQQINDSWAPRALLLEARENREQESQKKVQIQGNTTIKGPENNTRRPIISLNRSKADTASVKKFKVPRPRNAFIIYRGMKHDVVTSQSDVSNTMASRIIAKMWREEPQYIRDHYQNLAREEKHKHKLLHPEYRYSPRKPGEKQRRTKRKICRADNEIQSDYNITPILLFTDNEYEHGEDSSQTACISPGDSMSPTSSTLSDIEFKSDMSFDFLYEDLFDADLQLDLSPDLVETSAAEWPFLSSI
ncbi:hypothetical protein V1514DRAFT_75863 [Lipomyces japonicus]|uniref:uncharacterized protein n=1 Tax=Lipomyces japonicus TaxID=56871 RepID=UPI0034D0050E